jgi:hypothetical protein
MKKPWSTPYKWLSKYAWENVTHIYYDLTGGVKNVFRWIPLIWFDRDYDHAYLSRIMEYKLRRMATVFENGHHTTGKVDAKRCRVCAELLRRLEADDYMDNAERIFGVGNSPFTVRHAVAQQRHEQKYLGTLIGKYLTSWWD